MGLLRYHHSPETGTVECRQSFLPFPRLPNGDIVRKTLSLLALIAAIAAPATALAATIDASLIPDGTYTATVEKVADSKHMTVKMQNGVETVLTTTRPNVDFTKAKPNDQIKLSLIKGSVAVFIVTH